MKLFAIALAVTALVLAGSAPAVADVPYVEVAPSQVANGQTANVFGTGFCPTGGGCSTVSIAVGSKRVATANVDSAGKFSTTFVVNELSGSHTLTATQTANGSTLPAMTGMTVNLTDNRRSPTPSPSPVVNPPTGQPVVSQPPGGPVAATPSPSDQPGASPSESPTPASSPRPGNAASPTSNWWWVIGVLVLLGVAGAAAAIVWRRRQNPG